jgi:hypothetical protein
MPNVRTYSTKHENDNEFSFFFKKYDNKQHDSILLIIKDL